MSKIVFHVLFILLNLNCFSQKEFKFNHLTTKQGLSNNNVTSIIQDKKGFIWFGTASGLNRFDGYSFRVFSRIENDSTSLSDNRIRSLALDQDGKIWVGTRNGLNSFDPSTETCKRFYLNEKDSTTISDNRINRMIVSRDNVLWVATENGLNKFDPVTFKNKRFQKQLKTTIPQSGKLINTLAEDAEGNIWFGMWWGGLKKINPETLAITDYFTDQANKNSIGNNNVLSLFVDRDNALWIGCFMDGIRKMDLRTCQYLPVSGIEQSSASGAFAQDQSGNLWINAGPGVMVIYDPISRTSVTKSNAPNDASTISSGSVSSVLCDKTGIIWICSDKGVSYYDPQGQKFASYLFKPDLGRRAYCNSFYQSNKNEIWMGIYDIGLVKYNLRTGESFILPTKPGDPNSINNKNINAMFTGKDGNLWLATNNGICVVDQVTCKIIRRLYYDNQNSTAVLNGVSGLTTCWQSHFFWVVQGAIFDAMNENGIYLPEGGKSSINDIKIKCVIEDRKGDLWIGTEYSGLKHLQMFANQVIDYINRSDDPNSISSNTINDIFEDRKGNIWIATPNGLNKLDPDKDIFTIYKKKQGLSTNECLSVKEDSKGCLWIQNSGGIDKFDSKTGTVVTYSEANGLSLNPTCLFQNSQGYIIGGHSDNGFYMFHPDSIRSNKTLQPVYITDFFIFNESVPISSAKAKSPLKKSITETKEIVLGPDQSVFGFEFSMLNYTLAEKNIYEYKLDGFDNQWFRTDEKRRRITYTNLNPGDYDFRVRAANNDGIWNPTEASVMVRVLPPWYKTWWAYTIYFITISLILFFIRKYFIDKERLQHEVAIQKIEVAKTLELSQMKQNFFTSISHEFRTPLTLIAGPVQKLIKNIDVADRSKLLDSLQLIDRNAKRLSQLTDQLLDMRKLESGKMKLEISSGDFIDFIRTIASGFESLAEKKQIDFRIETLNLHQNHEVQWFDADKVDKIVTNLLSNAFKFTPENGKISVTIKNKRNNKTTIKKTTGAEDLDPDYFVIIVEDSGIGIPKDQLDKIFDRFYQVENTHKRSAEGTGIGLALTKELVILHKGSIEVVSAMGKGSRFKVYLPVAKLMLSESSIVIEETPAINSKELFPIETNANHADAIDDSSFQQLDSGKVPPEKDIRQILIVEDNPDMRLYIRDILKDKYQVSEAENGQQGWEIATSGLPDLIISDVMMPGLDGYELTNLLKNDLRTSHIPVILLTALSSPENLIKGLKIEADDYITKPFDDEVLMLVVKNMINSREKLKARYHAHIEAYQGKIKANSLEPSQPLIPDSEKIFLDMIMSVVEKNLANPVFDVQKFSSEIGMEASGFHRKLKALINQSPGDFLRSMRMKRAEQLLNNKELSIREIAEMVGYGNNANYFSTAFRKHFGKPPSDYQI